ncbi:MAG: HEPN domain-containing protein [Methylocella sp.]
MKPQTGAFLDKSRELLDRAETMLGAGLNADAGRTAYLAGLHAAQALIFECTGKAIRRHSGVQREFARLVKDDPRFDMELRAFLPRAYNFKAIADYETGPGSQVSGESARDAVQTARRFLECAAGLISANGRKG